MAVECREENFNNKELARLDKDVRLDLKELLDESHHVL